MNYNFPKTIFVEKNTFYQQIEHLLSEAEELRKAYEACKKEGSSVHDHRNLYEEFYDVGHSFETGCRILDKKSPAINSDGIFYTTAKNHAREYYTTEVCHEK